MDKYKEVVEALIRFRDERDWAQFHDSKNLALALLLEASELNELFLWKKESQAEEVNPERLKEELADVRLIHYCWPRSTIWTSSTLCWKKSGRTGRNIR